MRGDVVTVQPNSSNKTLKGRAVVLIFHYNPASQSASLIGNNHSQSRLRQYRFYHYTDFACSLLVDFWFIVNYLGVAWSNFVVSDDACQFFLEFVSNLVYIFVLVLFFIFQPQQLNRLEQSERRQHQHGAPERAEHRHRPDQHPAGEIFHWQFLRHPGRSRPRMRFFQPELLMLVFAFFVWTELLMEFSVVDIKQSLKSEQWRGLLLFQTLQFHKQLDWV